MMIYINTAKRVIQAQLVAMNKLLQDFSYDHFNLIVDYILNQDGKVILSGIGKSGYVARKIASSFLSIGVVAIFLHPAEASHGDLGIIKEKDIIIILSKSGETKELIPIVDYSKRSNLKLGLITMKANSNLANMCDFILLLPEIKEASLIDAPTTSSLMMLSIGDALTIAVQEAKGFSKLDLHFYHPGGYIGENILQVKDLMRVNKLPLAHEGASYTEIISIIENTGSDSVFIIDSNSRLLGCVRSRDLLKVKKEQFAIDIHDLMTCNNKYTNISESIKKVSAIMKENSLNIIPVLEKNLLIGVVCIQDLLKIV